MTSQTRQQLLDENERLRTSLEIARHDLAAVLDERDRLIVTGNKSAFVTGNKSLSADTSTPRNVLEARYRAVARLADAEGLTFREALARKHWNADEQAELMAYLDDEYGW